MEKREYGQDYKKRKKLLREWKRRGPAVARYGRYYLTPNGSLLPNKFLLPPPYELEEGVRYKMKDCPDHGQVLFSPKGCTVCLPQLR